MQPTFFNYVKDYKDAAQHYGDDSAQVEHALDMFVLRLKEMGCVITHQEAANELDLQIKYFPILAHTSYSRMF